MSSDSDQDPPRPAPAVAKEGERSRGLSRQSSVWLTTLSTVVAIATGMFTLRDQIFPQQRPEAQASLSLRAVRWPGVRRAERRREPARKNERHVAKRLRRDKRSTLAQRNALLDSSQQIVDRSEYALGEFRGLQAPSTLRAPAHQAVVAWTRIIAALHGYLERLGRTRNRRDLNAAIRTLNAARTKVAAYRVDRASALTRVGGGRCKLNAPITTPTITLAATTPGAIPPDASSPTGLAEPVNVLPYTP
jgi:hypothetical protein